MKINKERLVFILMGLLVGFAMGISIIFWKQSIDITQNLFHKSKQFIVGLFKSEQHEEAPKKIIVNKKPPKKKKLDVKDTPPDSLSTDSLNALLIDDVSPDDTVWYDEYSDVYTIINTSNDEVARDKLILKKQIKAHAVTKTTDNTASNIDSLLIGGKTVKEEKYKFTVEFWESPLNYRGYKKAKNSVVLFGIKQMDEVELKLINNDLYLCLPDMYYALENTNDFKSLVPLNNQQIINQLKGR